MKFVVLVLFSIGFLAITDAKVFDQLPNKGRILSRSGCYIPGRLKCYKLDINFKKLDALRHL